MILIIIKIILITVQVIVFSENNSNQVTFVQGSKTTFKHLFIKNWNSGYETLPYPPTSGQLAVYRVDEFYETLDYALLHYYNLENEAVGPYSYCNMNQPVMNLCVSHFSIGDVTPYNSTFVFSSDIITNCTDIGPISVNNKTVYDTKAYLQSKNFTIKFNSLTEGSLQFSLRSVQLKTFEIDELPDCFQFDLTISFDNSYHNGQLVIDLHTNMIQLECRSKPLMKTTKGTMITNILFVLDAFVLLLSFLSLILCSRSILRLYKFWKKAKEFFLTEMGVDITNKRNHFCNISYFIIFVGDVCIVAGTVIKMEMFSDLQKGFGIFTLCNYFLGLGLFFGYLTLLRYFSYFPKSSILVNTIQVAIPPLLRFSLCSIILYLAFALLGWIILGPYHLKFKTFESSVACLFSLMMGDDMYVTLSIIRAENIGIYIFSQVYVYLFLVLFIFVVLNLILTIIIEAYDNVKNHDDTAYQMDSFWNFINSCPETSQSPLYRSDKMHEKGKSNRRYSELARKFVDLFCCCIGHGSHTKEIQNIPISFGTDEELSGSFHAHDTHSRFCSIVANDFRSVCATNRYVRFDTLAVPQPSRFHNLSV